MGDVASGVLKAKAMLERGVNELKLRRVQEALEQQAQAQIREQQASDEHEQLFQDFQHTAAGLLHSGMSDLQGHKEALEAQGSPEVDLRQLIAPGGAISERPVNFKDPMSQLSPDAFMQSVMAMGPAGAAASAPQPGGPSSGGGLTAGLPVAGPTQTTTEFGMNMQPATNGFGLTQLIGVPQFSQRFTPNELTAKDVLGSRELEYEQDAVTQRAQAAAIANKQLADQAQAAKAELEKRREEAASALADKKGALAQQLQSLRDAAADSRLDKQIGATSALEDQRSGNTLERQQIKDDRLDKRGTAMENLKHVHRMAEQQGLARLKASLRPPPAPRGGGGGGGGKSGRSLTPGQAVNLKNSIDRSLKPLNDMQRELDGYLNQEDSGVGDVVRTMGLIHSIDSTAARDGEFARLARAAGIGDKITNYMSELKAGRVNKSLQDDVKRSLESMRQATVEESQRRSRNYTNMMQSEEVGVDPAPYLGKNYKDFNEGKADRLDSDAPPPKVAAPAAPAAPAGGGKGAGVPDNIRNILDKYKK